VSCSILVEPSLAGIPFTHHSRGSLPNVSTCSRITQSADGLNPSNSGRSPIISQIVHASVHISAGNKSDSWGSKCTSGGTKRAGAWE
jgi:hypothetical protein